MSGPPHLSLQSSRISPHYRRVSLCHPWCQSSLLPAGLEDTNGRPEASLSSHHGFSLCGSSALFYFLLMKRLWWTPAPCSWARIIVSRLLEKEGLSGLWKQPLNKHRLVLRGSTKGGLFSLFILGLNNMSELWLRIRIIFVFQGRRIWWSLGYEALTK